MPHTSKKKRKWRYASSSSESEFERQDVDMPPTDFLSSFKDALKDTEVQTLLGSILETSVISKLVEENRQLREQVDTLEQRMDEMEQYSRRTCLKIAGIPERANEETDKVILQMAKEMAVPLQEGEISRSHRLPNGKKKTPRDIVVRFTTYNKRLLFLKGRKKLRETRQHVYVNEHLTKQRSDIAFQCRQLKKDKLVVDTWTRDGKIFVKTERNGQGYIHGIVSNGELYDLIKLVKPKISAGMLRTPRLTMDTVRRDMRDIAEEAMQ